MEISNMIINNFNDIYVYFQVIRQYKPTSMLDIGMFLKRIGSVSRRTMNFEGLDGVKLEGIDIFPEYTLGVYSNVYDKIYKLDEIDLLPDDELYDIISIFRIDEFITKQQEKVLFNYAMENATYILSDNAFIQRQIQDGYIFKYYDITIEDEHYALIDTGSRR